MEEKIIVLEEEVMINGKSTTIIKYNDGTGIMRTYNKKLKMTVEVIYPATTNEEKIGQLKNLLKDEVIRRINTVQPAS